MGEAAWLLLAVTAVALFYLFRRSGYPAFRGGEVVVGRNVRVNLLGNWRRGRTWPERLPHYHRRGRPDALGRTPPGQGIGRHRPWQRSAHDKTVWDRF